MMSLEKGVDKVETTGTNQEFMTKVCGITNLEDALLSFEGGANSLGFNFYPKSPRFVEPSVVAKITESLPEYVLKIGVVVADPATFSRFVASGLQELLQAGIEAIQLHGIDRGSDIPDLGVRTIVATSPEGSSEFPDNEIIIDSSWGSGKLADWDAIKNALDRPFILSGGLTPENVGVALKELKPCGVDVCSGVEAVPGKKDPVRLKSFLSIVGSYCDDS